MTRKKKFISIVDDGFSFEGTIQFAGELLIRGRVGGKLTGDTVTIAEEGVANADMKVERMTIGGRFEGDVHAAGELVILPTGQCSGRVHCRSLVVQEGGRLNADVRQVDQRETIREKKLSAASKPVIDL
ncbi:MAG: polymer-forming cytoskeletal protein [Desulfobacterales bacterium]